MPKRNIAIAESPIAPSRKKSVPTEPKKREARRALGRLPLYARHHHAIGTMFGASFAAHLAGKIAAILLLPLLILHPIIPVFAADETVASVADPVSAPMEQIEPNAPTAEAQSSEPAIAEETVDTVTADEVLPEASTETLPIDEIPPADTTPDTLPPEEGSVPADIGTEVLGEATSTEAATGTEESIHAVGSAIDETASSTDLATTTESAEETPTEEPVLEETDSTDPTSTEEVATTTEEMRTPSVDELVAAELKSREESIRAAIRAEVEDSFTRGCVEMDGTGYYCLKNEQINKNQNKNENTNATAVMVKTDENGSDKEIYITKGNEEIRLTDNDYDDAFAAMDVSGGTVVWQANVDGRWQVFVADVATKTPVITQLTHGWESNFNPKVDGNRVVWQGWADGNWEIFLAERLPSGAEISSTDLPAQNKKLGIDGTWKVTRITNDDVHDMFPAISGSVITWQKNEGGSWAVFVYDTESARTTRLSDDGAKGEMPRFAMVWSERNPDGSQKLVSYDIAKGEKTNLTSEAQQAAYQEQPYRSEAPPPPPTAPEPIAIPAPVASGTTTMARSDGAEGGDGTGGDLPDVPSDDISNANDTATSSAVIDLSASSTTDVSEEVQ
jgi:beta propeller repeat protein